MRAEKRPLRPRGALGELVDWRLFAWGLATLIAGVLVYAVGRPAGSLALLPEAFDLDVRPCAQVAALLGPMPTFFHTLAFCLMSVAVAQPAPRGALVLCGIWLLIEVGFELGQLRETVPVARATPGTSPGFWAAFFERGSFDALDAIAACLGAAVAWFVIRRSP